MRKRIEKLIVVFSLVCMMTAESVYAEGITENQQLISNETTQVVNEEQEAQDRVENQNDVNAENEEQILNQEQITDRSAEVNDNLEVVQKGVAQYIIKYTFSSEPISVKKVKFAVWSELNGQDDLVWYDASKKENGIYETEVSLLNHVGLGKFLVHAYYVDENGNMNFLESTAFSTEEPKLNEPSVEIKDFEKGIIHATTGIIEKREYVQKVQFAVWSEDGGQDDLIWYDISPNADGEYEKDIFISNHKYALGKYYVHIYITDITGRRYGVCALEQEINAQLGTVSVENKTGSYEYNISVKGMVVPGGIEAVQFPVWSEVNGQDDIIWYNSTNVGNQYEKTISLMNHKGFGTYAVHAYAKTKGGKLLFLGNHSFEVEGPEIGKAEITNYDSKAGTFQVVFSDVKHDELIKEIKVPTWSAINGQDDIVWYSAKKSKDGTYVVDVNIKNHKYSMGTYISHAYMTDITGNTTGMVVGTLEVNIESGALTCTQGTSDKKQFKIELEGLKVPGGEIAVQFPIWSKVNGQDDIRWYTAKKNGDGKYSLTMSVADHKRLGAYAVHAYAKMADGSLKYIGNTEFKVDAPTIGAIEVNDQKKKSGEFQVKITGIQHNELIKQIQVPIWSEGNQGDIVWYNATRNQEGDYVVNVNISNHKYNLGLYKIHVYMTDITGAKQWMGATSCDISSTYTNLKVEDIAGTESTYKITLSGLEVPAGEKAVSFAVWGSSSGQNDIIWYNASKDSNGNYTCDVKIRNHKELGSYNVHAYCITKGGNRAFIGATSFEVQSVPNTIVSVTDINGTKGSFKVTVSAVGAASGIEKIQVPVWCAANQSDIVWYTAIKDGSGNYVVNVPVSNHAHHFGTYKIHTYITMGNGVTVFGGSNQCNIIAKDYVYNVSLSATKREVGIMGASASRVQFPSWSDANGQDDIIWYEGVNQGKGKWNAVVDSTKHNNGGNYTTHIYVTSNGTKYNAGATHYSLTKAPTDQGLMQARANLYGSSTPYIILVNRSTHKVGVFQGWQGNWTCIRYWDCSDGAPSTPTVEGTFTVGIRGYYFDSGASRCYWYTQFKGNYLFHSVLYNKNGTLRDGRLGMPLSHGCVRLDINNAKWIYDTIPSGTTVVVYH